ncbi:hypothetical protein GCM10009122_52370 [Fulvivirga kasyanovii]|uniref:hypothetical protein n=1 Tax=Fulvivirga kasyanovii TaxID=396812 RepID=UPI0031D4AB2E
MRIFILITVLMLVIACTDKKSSEKDLSYKEFLFEFKDFEKPFVLGPKLILKSYLRGYVAGSSRLLNPQLRNQFLSKDSTTFSKYVMHDSLFITRNPVKPIGKTTLSNYDVLLYMIADGGGGYTFDYLRVGLFKDEKLLNSFNVAISALSFRHSKDIYLVTAIISENKIDQYKIAMEYHEEPNNFELGNEDYYFTLKDTLAVSTLEIQADGSILGKNLAELPDDK